MVSNGRAPRRRFASGFSAGAVVGTLGGLIGLGGAEFRLPLLIGLFRFGPLEAVILNKAASLVVVTVSLPARAAAVPIERVAEHWPIILNLLAGSLIGAWLGADWATRLRTPTLYRVIALMLAAMAVLLVLGHGDGQARAPLLLGAPQQIAGVAAGLGIGVVSAVLGVAGGELLIPTLLLLFGTDIRLAGSLSLAVSLPTMLMGFARYSRDGSFAVLARERPFFVAMAAGSIAGSVTGALLLAWVAAATLLPILSAILLLSAVKVWRLAR